MKLDTVQINQEALRNQVKPLRTTAEQASDNAKSVKRLKNLRQACSDLESYFVGALIKAMRKTMPEEGFIKKSVGMDNYDAIADEQLSQYLTRGRGLGLGQAVFEQMVRREGLEDVVENTPELKAQSSIGRLPQDRFKPVDGGPPKTDPAFFKGLPLRGELK
jgi:flagellar protein FlgJ